MPHNLATVYELFFVLQLILMIIKSMFLHIEHTMHYDIVHECGSCCDARRIEMDTVAFFGVIFCSNLAMEGVVIASFSRR